MSSDEREDYYEADPTGDGTVYYDAGHIGDGFFDAAYMENLYYQAAMAMMDNDDTGPQPDIDGDYYYDADPQADDGDGFDCATYNHDTGKKEYYHADHVDHCLDSNQPLNTSSDWAPSRRYFEAPSENAYDEQSDSDDDYTGNYPVADVHGSCQGNGQEGARGGYGVNWGEGNPNNISEALPGGRQTQNRAYLEGAEKAINQAKEQGYGGVTVETNSKYLADGASKYLPQWEQQGYRKNDGGQLKNADQWQSLQQAQKGIDVQYKYQPGPSGSQQLSRGGAGGSQYQ